MTSSQSLNRLHTQLAQMIALEVGIEQRLERLIPEVSNHIGTISLLENVKNLSRDHRQALETRLRNLIDNPSNYESQNVTSFLTNGLSMDENYPVSASLQAVYTLLNQAIIGYSVLHPLATRFLDSPYVATEGTSFHLTRQHTENYVQAIQQISRLIHDVVIWELDEEECECQCGCISCRSGICLCSHAGRAFLSNAWAAVGPISTNELLYVQHPKKNTPAANAGLHKGDVILGANGKDFNSFWDIFSVLENAKSGEEIRLLVRRAPDVVEEIAMVCL
ncbi:MAG: PDZ domain-containing protein [Bellilinea sp.]